MKEKRRSEKKEREQISEIFPCVSLSLALYLSPRRKSLLFPFLLPNLPSPNLARDFKRGEKKEKKRKRLFDFKSKKKASSIPFLLLL